MTFGAGAEPLRATLFIPGLSGNSPGLRKSTAIDYLEKIRQSIMESQVKVREHIKQDASGKVIMKEIHKETLPPDIKGAMWWLERRFPEQFGRREQLEHSGGVKVQSTQTQERKLTIELVKSDGEVHRLTRDDAMAADPKPEPE